jgi:anti-sigma factor RsiW
MLTCTRVVKQLSDFIDNSLGAEMQAAMAQHLENCKGCRVLRETYESTQHLCREILQTSCPAELGDRLLAFLRREIHKP